MARTNFVKRQSSSNSRSKKSQMLANDQPSPSAGSLPEISKLVHANSSSTSDGFRKEIAVQLGGLVGFQYGEPPKAFSPSGADNDS